MSEIKENKMGVMPVGKLLWSMSIPTMISMLVQALYNIVDSIFVARYNQLCLTAVSIAFPMQNLLASFAVGTSVGINSLISRRLGEKREEEASKTACNGIVLMLITYAVFCIIGLTVSGPFMRLYTDDPLLIGYGKTYLEICLCFSFGTFLSIAFEKILQSTGDTIGSMFVQISGAVINCILDPIMIFGLFGCPEMGIKGAAIATVAGQMGSMVLGYVLSKRNKYIKVRVGNFRLYGDITGSIYSVGVPSILMQAIGTVMNSLMNLILMGFTAAATTVFGVYFKLQSFVFMPLFGLNSGMVPIIGYNYGARNPERMKKTLRLALIGGVLIMTFGLCLFHIAPKMLLSMFNATEEMYEIGAHAFRIVSLCFIPASVSIIIGGVFQAVGDGYYSMILSIVRQLMILLPAAYILGKLFGLSAVWYAFPFAEVFAIALSLIFYRQETKKIRKKFGVY